VGQVPDLPKMIRHYITDRLALSPGQSLLDSIARNLRTGADQIQIREKDLSARDLHALVQAALALPNPRNIPILVNTRVDIAIAAGASGSHLPAGSPGPQSWRNLVPQGFLIGVSCHTREEITTAEAEEADYVVFGPVFAPLSKTSNLAPRGLDGLAQAVKATRLPVFALGGITSENAPRCEAAGARGIAGISLFQSQFSSSS
jgi:thiamine-phosphate pyrophosphorylase